MAKNESGGGAIGGLWKKHGGGYYALLAIGTFVWLEIVSLIESFQGAEGFRDFVEGELIETIFTFGIQTFINSFLAGMWPFIWIDRMGLGRAFLFVAGGYAVWATTLAWLLARREKALRSELGL